MYEDKIQNKNIIYGYLVTVLKPEENQHQVHYHGSLGNEKQLRM